MGMAKQRQIIHRSGTAPARIRLDFLPNSNEHVSGTYFKSGKQQNRRGIATNLPYGFKLHLPFQHRLSTARYLADAPLTVCRKSSHVYNDVHKVVAMGMYSSTLQKEINRLEEMGRILHMAVYPSGPQRHQGNHPITTYFCVTSTVRSPHSQAHPHPKNNPGEIPPPHGENIQGSG